MHSDVGDGCVPPDGSISLQKAKEVLVVLRIHHRQASSRKCRDVVEGEQERRQKPTNDVHGDAIVPDGSPTEAT